MNSNLIALKKWRDEKRSIARKFTNIEMSTLDINYSKEILEKELKS